LHHLQAPGTDGTAKNAVMMARCGGGSAPKQGQKQGKKRRFGRRF